MFGRKKLYDEIGRLASLVNDLRADNQDLSEENTALHNAVSRVAEQAHRLGFEVGNLRAENMRLQDKLRSIHKTAESALPRVCAGVTVTGRAT